jgi:hypothetical protein
MPDHIRKRRHNIRKAGGSPGKSKYIGRKALRKVLEKGPPCLARKNQLDGCMRCQEGIKLNPDCLWVRGGDNTTDLV